MISRTPHAALVIALTMTLAGCAVGPNFKVPPAPVSTQYTPVAPPALVPATATSPAQTLEMGAVLPGRWWTQFNSPALDRLVDMALVANTDLAVADATLRQSRAQARVAAGARYPEVEAGLQTERTRASKVFSDPLTEPGVFLYSLNTATLNVTYPLDLFGGTRRRVESARALAAADAFRLEAAKATVAANTVLAAIEEAALRGKIAATNASITANRDVLALLRVQQAAGAVGKADIAAQVAVLAQAEGTLPTLNKALVHQQSALSILLGREPSEPLPATVELDQLTLPATLPVTLPSVLVRQRPDVRAAEAALHAASADVGVAVAARLPAFTLSAAVGGQALRFGDMFKDGNPFWSLIGGLTQPLFNGGALRNEQKAAEAAFDGAKAQYRAAVLNAFGDVANALTAVHADALALASAETADQAAAENLRYLGYQQRLGQVGSLALLTGTAMRVETATALIDARAARFNDVAGLYLALGGSTDEPR